MTSDLKNFLVRNKENFEDNNWTQIMYNVDGGLNSVLLIKEFRELLKKLGVLDEVMTSTTFLPPWFFTEDNDLTFINIPGNIKHIGYDCFGNCQNLTKVVLNEGIEVINLYAFKSCPIKSIKIPESIKRIEDNAFFKNHVMREIYVPLSYISKFPQKTNKVKDWFGDMTYEDFEKIAVWMI